VIKILRALLLARTKSGVDGFKTLRKASVDGLPARSLAACKSKQQGG
jgi:hypothetical protein